MTTISGLGVHQASNGRLKKNNPKGMVRFGVQRYTRAQLFEDYVEPPDVFQRRIRELSPKSQELEGACRKAHISYDEACDQKTYIRDPDGKLGDKLKRIEAQANEIIRQYQEHVERKRAPQEGGSASPVKRRKLSASSSGPRVIKSPYKSVPILPTIPEEPPGTQNFPHS